MVPKGWEVKRLEELCSPDAPITYGVLKPGDFYQGGIPLLQIKDLRDGGVLTDDIHLISPALDDEYRRSRIIKDDILISLVGTIGRIAKYRNAADANIHRNIGRIRSEIHEYLYHFLISSRAQNEIGVSSSGSSQAALNLSTLRSMKIPVPPLPEQKIIAQILSIWDKTITTTEKLLASSQQQKKALMQQLLTGKKRLLDKNGARFSEEWKATALSKMGKIVSGGTPDTNIKEFWAGEIQWLTPTDVTALKSRFVSSTFRTISDLGIKNSSATLLPKGSLMVCTRATIGALAISTTDICTNQGFKNIIPSLDFDVEFIYYLLSFFSKELLRKSSGSTFLELSKKDFEKIEMLCPSLKEQKKIAEVLSNADQEITTLQQKIHALKQEKKALMQQLLTGKRRVKLN